MTADERTRQLTSSQLSSGLGDLAGPARLDYRDDILRQVARTRQRPRWTFLERWLPMPFASARPATAPPMRAAWVLLIVGLLAAAVAASLVIVGSRLLGPKDPVRLSGAALVPTLELDRSWDPSRITGLDHPQGMDLGPDGNLYVANAGASEVVVIDPSGTIVRRWGALGSDPGQFRFQPDPTSVDSVLGGVAVGPDGSAYVADPMNFRVQQFDAAGSFVRQWGTFGSGDGEFLLPTDLATAPDGSVYVMDQTRDDIQRFSAEGAYISTVARHGPGPDQLDSVSGVVVGRDGTVLITSGHASRVEIREPDGTFRSSFGTLGTGPGQFTYPSDLAIDGTGNLYVAEPTRVQVFDPDLRLASVWQAPAGAQQYPEDWLALAAADDGTLYVGVPRDDAILRVRVVERERDAAVETAFATAASAAPAAASPTASPSETPVPAVAWRSFSSPDQFAVPFTAQLPPGWRLNWLQAPGGLELAKPRPGDPNGTLGNVRVFVPTNAYADPCRSVGGPIVPPIGPGVDDLTAVLTDLPGFRLTSPLTDVTLGGFAGQQLELEHSVDSRLCDGDPWLPQWTYDDAGRQASSGPGWDFHQRIAVLDVRGTRVLVEAWTFHSTTPADLDETNAVFESIHFD